MERILWHVFIVIYNLQLEMCMKEVYIFLLLLILGPRPTGRNIDVFLKPLIDELKTLWVKGEKTYDAYQCEHFRMRACLL